MSKIFAGRAPNLKKVYDIVIIGGGAHGLATAYYLSKMGVHPFEKYGVVHVSDLDNLYENLEKLLSDSNLQSKLEENRNQFLLDQFNIPAKDTADQLRSILGIKQNN